MRSRNSRNRQYVSLVRRSGAILSIVALLVSTFAAGISAQSMNGSMKAADTKRTAKLSEDQRILHVLNRLGFGARPGDVERVKANGRRELHRPAAFPGKD